MRISKVIIEKFRNIKNKELDFPDSETGLAQDLIILTGMNGSGKTSILQPILLSHRPPSLMHTFIPYKN